MKDKQFIEEMVEKGKRAGERVKASFNDLSLAQLDWRPANESWSIGQCLDHLIIADCLYFPVLKKITEGKYRMNFWERWSPFSGLFGIILLDIVKEKQRRRSPTARILIPPDTTIDAVILERFHKHLDSLLGYIAACSGHNIDRIWISSPVSRFVTYSLRKAILILVEHEHRHINQALRVRAAKDFPAS
ncbi:MAG TPA: DinB family protein [Chitinophagaceae bacterium]|nr:DinB family protein [Chitinophagaceae bacterium]